MPLLDRFLEISLPSEDVQASLMFWQELGLSELDTGDILEHHYAVVTDGHTGIGLHGQGPEHVACTWIREDLADWVPRLPQEPSSLQLGDEQFHTARFEDADGHELRLVEARTYSPLAVEPDVPVVGRLESVTLTCRDLGKALAFWHGFGFRLEVAEDHQGARLVAPGPAVVLETGRRREPAMLNFVSRDIDGLLRFLDQRMIEHDENDGFIEIPSPEGIVVTVSAARES